MGNEIAQGKRVLVRLQPEDQELTPAIVTAIEGIRVTVLANGAEHETSLLSTISGDLKLATQDTDPAAWMLHDGKTSKHAPGVQEIGLEHGCYICQDPEFAQMGLPLCRPCPDCQRNGRGSGHIPADDSACNVCEYEDSPDDYPQPEPVPPFKAVVAATIPIPDHEWRPGEDTIIPVPQNCTVSGVQIWDSSDPARPVYWIAVGKTLQANDSLHVSGSLSITAS